MATSTPAKWAERLATYRSCIKAAQTFMADEGLHTKWKRYIDVYSENRCTDDQTQELEVHVPIAFSNINIQRAALTVHNPRFTVNPRNAESLLASALCEQVLNYEWDRYDYQEQIRKAVDDYLITGNMWGKVGYLQRKWGDDVEGGLTTARLSQIDNPGGFNFDVFENEGFDSEFDKMIEQSRGVLWQTHAVGDTLPTRSKLAKELRTRGFALIHDRTMFERVSPFDMYVDPKATCLTNAQWVAQRVPVRIDVARENKEWDKDSREALGVKPKITSKSNGSIRPTPNHTPIIQGEGSGTVEAHQWVDTWELYDLHTGEWMQFGEEGDDFLRRPEPSPFRFGHPFAYRGNYSVPDCFHHIGEIEMVEPLQRELNRTRQDLVSARAQVRRKYLIDKKLWDSGATDGAKSPRSVITSPEDNVVGVVEVMQGQNIKDMICLLPQHQVDPNMYNVYASVMNDMNQVTGITDFQRGAGSGGSSTATEAAILNDGALARLQEKQGKLEGFMRDVAENLIMLKQEYMTADQAVRITDGGVTQAATRFRDRMDEATGNRTGSDVLEGLFLPYGRNDIVGEFDFKVEAGSSTAFNETQRRRQYQELMQTLIPLAPLIPGLDLEGLVVEMLQQGFRIPNAARFVRPAQQAQQVNPVTGQPGGGISTQAGISALNGGIPESASGVPPSLDALQNQVLPNRISQLQG